MAIHRRAGVTYEPSGDTVVILDADGTTMTTLNPVGAVIWKAIDGQADPAALARQLLPGFEGVDPAELEHDVESFLEELVAAELVEID
jgi:hypothetical protein